jgi:hypothetical protein
MAKRQRVPQITQEEVASIVHNKREVTGFSAKNSDHLLFLKVVGLNGDIGLFSMSTIVADYLLRHLEIVLKGAEREPDAGSPTKWAKQNVAASYGHVFPPNSRNGR